MAMNSSDMTWKGGTARVETLTRWDELERLRAQWDALNDQAGGGIYGAFEWCRTWWEFYGEGRRLDVRCVYRGTQLVAIFKFFRETQWVGVAPLRLVRLVGCDFGVEAGAIAMAPGAEDEAIGALAASMGRDWDVIHLGPFPGYVEIKPSVVAAFAKHFDGTSVRFMDNVRPHAVFELPASFEEFLKQVEKHQRADIQRLERLLVKSHKVEHRVRETREELEEALPPFLESHGKLWRAKGLRGYFNEWPEAKAFHGRVVERLERGKAFMSELVVDGAAVAQQYGFRSGDILHWFQPTREDTAQWRRLGVGNIGFLKMVEYAIAGGAKRIDGGGPPIDYKVRLGGKVVSKKLITIRRCGAGTRAKLGLFKAGGWALNKAYASLWYRRAAPRLKMTGSPFWRTWVKSRVKL